MASVSFRDSGAYWHGARAQMSEPEPAPDIAAVPIGSMVNIAAACVSAALVIGLAVWGYRLAVRDVTGVPVIQALEGPSRIAPEDPGGALARHVGLSVNAVAATGTAEPLADHIVLAPRPFELDAEDVPMAALAPLPAVQLPAEPLGAADVAERALPQLDPQMRPQATAAAPAQSQASVALPDMGEGEPSAVILALAEALAYSATLSPLAHLPSAPTAAPPTPPLVAASVPGVARSPLPLRRPTGIEPPRAQVTLAAASATAPISVRELDPTSLAAGTPLVQLGAFDDVQSARREWDIVTARFSSLMEGKNRVIQEASSGGRSFFRLRVEGFVDVDDARRFCAALLAEQSNCIPAQVR